MVTCLGREKQWELFVAETGVSIGGKGRGEKMEIKGARKFSGLSRLLDGRGGIVLDLLSFDILRGNLWV